MKIWIYLGTLAMGCYLGLSKQTLESKPVGNVPEVQVVPKLSQPYDTTTGLIQEDLYYLEQRIQEQMEQDSVLKKKRGI